MGVAADLPEPLQKQIEISVTKYAESLKEADDRLLKAFDAELALVRKQGNLKAEERLLLIEKISADKAIYEKKGLLPLSSRMRPASVSYIKSVQEAKSPLSTAYDKAIDHLSKAKDDAGATAKLNEKRKLLEPKIASRWNCAGVTWKGNMTYVLYSDGTARIETEPEIATWTIGKDVVVIRKPDARAPGGAWIETCQIDASGLTMLATNQRGGKWRGTRIDGAK